MNAARLIEIAEAEIGYLEKQSNSQLDDKTANAGSGNYTKYARDLDAIPGFYNFAKQGYAWCDIFVDWCFVKAFGVDIAKRLLLQPENSYGAGCLFSSRYYKRNNQFHTENPKPGDQIFFWTAAKDDVAHTGIVYKVDDTYVYTIEGNTSGASGVIANGGGVCKKKYKLTYDRIYGYGRPAYEEIKQEEQKEETVAKVKLDVDGLWGSATTTRLQQIFGTPVDGVVSDQWASYKATNPGLVNGWEWEKKPNGNGSALIKKMQEWANMPPSQRDGRIGPATIKAFQKKLGTTVDGVASRPSAMVKALQKWANNQP